SSNRIPDHTPISISPRSIRLQQGKPACLTVSDPQPLVRRGNRPSRCARLHVEWIAKPKRVQRASPRLEKRHHLVKVLDRPHPRSGIIPPTRLAGPRVALL